jgi:hypothetical protein
MAYKTFKRFESAVDEQIYQKAQALYLDDTDPQSISWEDSNGNTTTLTIPNREIIPFGVYKIKALPGSGTLYILY